MSIVFWVGGSVDLGLLAVGTEAERAGLSGRTAGALRELRWVGCGTRCGQGRVGAWTARVEERAAMLSRLRG